MAFWSDASRYERVATGLHLGSLVTAFTVIAYLDRGIWFGIDDFDFLADRGLHRSTYSIFYPHNQHWTTIPILIWRALFTLVKMHTAFPYLLVLLVAHVALAHVLWRAMRRMHVEPMLATALVVVFEFLGAGDENIVVPFQICFTGAVLLGWLFVLLHNRATPASGWRWFAAPVVGILSLMMSGVSVTMVVVGGLVALLRRGPRAAGVAVAPPAVVYLTWFLAVGHQAFVSSQSIGATVRSIPAYVYSGITSALSQTIDKHLGTGLGLAAFLLLALWLVLRHDLARTEAAPAFGAAAGAVIFFAITAAGRSQLGTLQASAPRYVYVCLALLLPAFGLLLSSLVDPAPTLRALRASVPAGWTAAAPRPRAAIVVLLLVPLGWVVYANYQLLVLGTRFFVARSQRIETQLLAEVPVARSGTTIPGSTPAGDLGVRRFTTAQLVELSRAGALPTGVAIPKQALAGAAEALQFARTPSLLYARPAAELVGAQRVPRGTLHFGASLSPPAERRSGCFSLTSPTDFDVATVRTTGGTSIQFSATSKSIVDMEASIGPAAFVTRYAIGPDDGWWLNYSSAGDTLAFLLPKGVTLSGC